MNFNTRILMAFLFAFFAVNQASAENKTTSQLKWDGQYLGFSVGASKGKADPTVNVKKTTFFTTTDPEQVDPQASHDMDATNFSGNLFWGLNRQTDNIVYGFEVDVSLASYDEEYNSGRITFLSLTSDSFTLKTRVRSDWALSIRPRLGYAIKNSLFYVSAGPAMRQFKYDFTYSDSPTYNQSANVSESKWKLGLVAGFGYELKMQGAWSFRAEYLYSSYKNIINTQSSLPDYPADGFNHKLDFMDQSLRLGLIKKF